MHEILSWRQDLGQGWAHYTKIKRGRAVWALEPDEEFSLDLPQASVGEIPMDLTGVW